MDFLGIGPLELLMILLIILIVLGPTDMVKVGSQVGKYLRQLMTSETWRSVQKTSRAIRNLPNSLARQAGIEEIDAMQRDLKEEMANILPEADAGGGLDAWTKLPKTTDGAAASQEAETEEESGQTESADEEEA